MFWLPLCWGGRSSYVKMILVLSLSLTCPLTPPTLPQCSEGPAVHVLSVICLLVFNVASRHVTLNVYSWQFTVFEESHYCKRVGPSEDKLLYYLWSTCTEIRTNGGVLIGF